MWQDNFIDALCNADLNVPQEIVAYDDMRDDKRFDVYRNNVFVSLTEAIETGFPLCQKLVGDDFFRALARTYCGKHLPTSPVLLWYGADFADFLATFPPAQQVPYLPDVARLEFAEREATHAADAPWYSQNAIIDDVDADKLLQLNVKLHPSVRCIDSAYPLFDIWYRTRHDDQHPIQSHAQDIVLYRPEDKPIIAALPIGGKVFLDKLSQEHTIANAAEAAFTDNPDTQLDLLLPLGLQLATTSH